MFLPQLSGIDPGSVIEMPSRAENNGLALPDYLEVLNGGKFRG